jgi:hypothetical protein
MDLGMFDRLCPSLKTRALIDERRLDMSRSNKHSDRYVIPMHERMFGLKNGCRILEIIFCRLATMILVHIIEEVGDHLKGRED